MNYKEVDDIIDKLLSHDVIEMNTEEDLLTLSEEFQKRIADEKYDDNQISTICSSDTIVEYITSHDLERETIFINRSFDNLSEIDLIRMMLLISVLQRNPPQSEHEPASFTSIHGDTVEIQTLLEKRIVLYIWREDCQPCELMRDRLDLVFNETPENAALLSVCGPTMDMQLRRKWDVSGAPTILFIVDGEVESRLQGLYSSQAIKSNFTSFLNKPA